MPPFISCRMASSRGAILRLAAHSSKFASSAALIGTSTITSRVGGLLQIVAFVRQFLLLLPCPVLYQFGALSP